MGGFLRGRSSSRSVSSSEAPARPATAERSAAALPDAPPTPLASADAPRSARSAEAAHAGGHEPAFIPAGPTAILEAWLSTRDWLRRRVPAQIAADADPLLALERLRDHLDVLESRLARQEGDLRGASEDVARGIEVQLRRARGQVRRLNQHLEGIAFGSISAIRVDMRRVDRMEQILRALSAGDAQELLFLPSMPIEEALDEIFRRYGGGRGGGSRLLDYREYLELVVEVRRRTGEAWEPASPARLSTGEAIGVGAALMMVVLTEWERDANLLRARPMPGSLRFLFLDEANRLSRDNLGVLFELCRNLDLQLLIAAPEVARAEGNTTYRLVRHVTEDGHEEVLVSGRRAISPGELPSEDAEPQAEPQAEPATEHNEPQAEPEAENRDGNRNRTGNSDGRGDPTAEPASAPEAAAAAQAPPELQGSEARPAPEEPEEPPYRFDDDDDAADDYDEVSSDDSDS
ncbi:MAG TPA: SbcC/MukB-like Walker B domain-containing protein [Kofleriaceae bacterium]|nr:SbcC/MukB-like Walker B domain-containing protein [Kofleriaceae bacterium]